ncbi:MAG: TrbC/VirB2 family protein [Anaplasma sp.]
MLSYKFWAFAMLVVSFVWLFATTSSAIAGDVAGAAVEAAEDSGIYGVFVAEAQANQAQDDDAATKVICNVVLFVQKLGLPIMTGVILGSSIMAIFGRLAWPAIAMLVVFTAIFFGAGKLMGKFAAGLSGTGASDAANFDCATKAGNPAAAAKAAAVAYDEE